MKNKSANIKLVRMGLMTSFMGVLLLNLVRLNDGLPDWVIRLVGIATIIFTVLLVFFAARQAVMNGANSESKSE